jgi:hypothetical protein
VRKLDADFFAGRWENLTDRQRDFLLCIAHLEHADEEFTISEIVEASKTLGGPKPFTPNDVSQILWAPSHLAPRRHQELLVGLPARCGGGAVRKYVAAPNTRRRTSGIIHADGSASITAY